MKEIQKNHFEIMEELQISRGNSNMNVRALMDWDPEKDKDSDQKIIELFYDIETLGINKLLSNPSLIKRLLVA